MRKKDDLFSAAAEESTMGNAPLAVRMRPTSLDELVGQDATVGEGTWLREAIEDDALSSIILFGPPGSGKTSLAHVIALRTSAVFVEVSAVSGSVADLRHEIDAAADRLSFTGQRTILFIDEIHRFSRSQQDALLHAVENRVVILIGATTENPFFEVNTALISRSRVIELVSLSDSDVETVVMRALEDPRGLAAHFALTREALEAIVCGAGGDARGALTTLELAAALCRPASSVPSGESLVEVSESSRIAADGNSAARTQVICAASVAEAMPHHMLPYDKKGDMHYDIISAFIKSMRGSDPDAAVYWLARMIEGGEDPKFIARRIFILASEDIGNADPNALLIAQAAFKSAEVIGYPECRINLAQAAIYMALAPKSNAVIQAIDSASAEVRQGPLRAVPDHLRDRHRPGSENYGKYCYPHSYEGAWVDQRYLPDGLEKGVFYQPTERGWEAYRTQATLRDRSEKGQGAENC